MLVHAVIAHTCPGMCPHVIVDEDSLQKNLAGLRMPQNQCKNSQMGSAFDTALLNFALSAKTFFGHTRKALFKSFLLMCSDVFGTQRTIQHNMECNMQGM